MQKLASVLAGPPEVAQEGLQEAANRLCGLGGGVPGTHGGIPGPPGGGAGGGGGMPPRLVKFRCEVPARSGDADLGGPSSPERVPGTLPPCRTLEKSWMSPAVSRQFDLLVGH